MAATVTLAQLRTRARLYADERPGGTDTYLTNIEVNELVNQALKELFDKLVAARGPEYYLNTGTFPTVAGQGSYLLSADFYELYEIWIAWGATDLEPLDEYSLRERLDLINWSTWGRWSPKGFRVQGGNVHIAPTPTTVVTVNYQYLPAFTELLADGDTFDGVNGWDKLVALRVAMEMRAIQEEDNTDLEKLYMREEARIDGLAADRAANQPKRVRDVQPERARGAWLERLPRP